MSSERLHAMDAVRGFALLLGLVVHASMSFLPGFTAWPILDSSPSVALAVTFFTSHLFRMVLFFLIAGFFAHLLMERRGMGAFWKNRLKRIGIPLVGGWMVIYPLVVLSILFGYLHTHPGVTSAPATPAASLPVGFFPFAHLWFLYYLMLFYAGASVLRLLGGLVDRKGWTMGLADRFMALLMKTDLGLVALAVPAAWVLSQQPGWVLWAGIPTPDMSAIPQMPAVAAFGTAFAAGWLLHRQQGLLASIERRGVLHLIGAVALTAGCLYFGGLSPATAAAAPKGFAVFGLALAYTTAGWSWTFAILGLGLRYLNQESCTRRYLADASYWIYLMHLPVVLVLSALAAPLPAPWFVKFPAIISTALGLLLLSYRYLVRPTWIGALLNGRRYPRRALPRPDAGAAAAEVAGIPQR